VVNRYAKSKGLLKDKEDNLLGEDIREGLTAIISVKLPNPQFEGQTKNKLGNTVMRSLVEKVTNEKLADWLEENPTEARQALVIGRDDLARAILQRRQVAALESKRLEAQENGLVEEDQRLALLAQRLLAQIESLSTLQNVAAAQYSAAETRARIAEALASVARNLGNLGVDVARAEQKTEWMRAFARAIDDLSAEGGDSRSGSSLGEQSKRRPDELEQTVDERIDLLKSQLTQSKSTGEQREETDSSESRPP